MPDRRGTYLAIFDNDGYWHYPASWHSPRADERDRVTSGYALQLFPFICMLDFDFGRKARPTESKESLPGRSWSQSTTNAIKTMLAEKAPSVALIGGASNTKRYLLCRRARSKGGGRTRLITGIALTKPVLRLDPGSRFQKPLPRQARQRAKAQLRCACRRPVARIESKHPHNSNEIDWTPHGDPQHLCSNVYDFAFCPEPCYDRLVDLADPEDWGPGNRILKNYLSFSFSRAVFLTERDVDQTAPSNLPLVFDDDRCLFNTGLYTRRYETIYGLFEPNTKPDARQRWFLKGFFKESDPMLVSFEYLPCRVRFAEDPSELVFDYRLPIRSNIDHILGDEENLTRIPASLMGEGNSLLLRRAFEGAVVGAARRAAANYTLAVPQFYGGRIQLLLPLCLTGDKPELALTIQREDGFYAARTCLTLDMAYNNARLICRPETSWIKR